MKKLAFNIAIDGPAGAGKSTIAKMVAKKLNFIYVDTGAMYRAIALYLLRGGVDTADETAVSEAVKNADITIRYQDGAQQVILNGEDVSGLIRTEEVGNTASATSVYRLCARIYWSCREAWQPARTLLWMAVISVPAFCRMHKPRFT